MLEKLNRKIDELSSDLQHIKVKEDEDVYVKLCDAKSDLETFKNKLNKTIQWIGAGIQFLRED